MTQIGDGPTAQQRQEISGRIENALKRQREGHAQTAYEILGLSNPGTVDFDEGRIAQQVRWVGEFIESARAFNPPPPAIQEFIQGIPNIEAAAAVLSNPAARQAYDEIARVIVASREGNLYQRLGLDTPTENGSLGFAFGLAEAAQTVEKIRKYADSPEAIFSECADIPGGVNLELLVQHLSRAGSGGAQSFAEQEASDGGVIARLEEAVRILSDAGLESSYRQYRQGLEDAGSMHEQRLPQPPVEAEGTSLSPEESRLDAVYQQMLAQQRLMTEALERVVQQQAVQQQAVQQQVQQPPQLPIPPQAPVLPLPPQAPAMPALPRQVLENDATYLEQLLRDDRHLRDSIGYNRAFAFFDVLTEDRPGGGRGQALLANAPLAVVQASVESVLERIEHLVPENGLISAEAQAVFNAHPEINPNELALLRDELLNFQMNLASNTSWGNYIQAETAKMQGRMDALSRNVLPFDHYCQNNGPRLDTALTAFGLERYNRDDIEIEYDRITCELDNYRRLGLSPGSTVSVDGVQRNYDLASLQDSFDRARNHLQSEWDPATPQGLANHETQRANREAHDQLDLTRRRQKFFGNPSIMQWAALVAPIGAWVGSAAAAAGLLKLALLGIGILSGGNLMLCAIGVVGLAWFGLSKGMPLLGRWFMLPAQVANSCFNHVKGLYARDYEMEVRYLRENFIDVPEAVDVCKKIRDMILLDLGIRRSNPKFTHLIQALESWEETVADKTGRYPMNGIDRSHERTQCENRLRAMCASLEEEESFLCVPGKVFVWPWHRINNPDYNVGRRASQWIGVYIRAIQTRFEYDSAGDQTAKQMLLNRLLGEINELPLVDRPDPINQGRVIFGVPSQVAWWKHTPVRMSVGFWGLSGVLGKFLAGGK